jgi:transcriptional regulator with XRE-family HTH domain
MNHTTIGNRIKMLRMKKGLMQKELASDLSVTSGTISNWENDRRLPSIEELSRIANYFEVSLNAFDLAQSDYLPGDVEKSTLDAFQTITVRKLGYRTSNIQVILLILSLILIPIGLYFGQSYIWFFYFLSVTGFLTVQFLSLNRDLHETRQNRKTYFYPITHEIVYEHKKETDEIKAWQDRYKRLSLVFLTLTGIQYLIIMVLLFPIISLISNIIITLLSLLVILLSYMSNVFISNNGAWGKRIPYYSVCKSMNSYSMWLAPLAHILAYAFISFVVIRETTYSSHPVLILSIASLLIVNALFYHLLYVFYKSFIHDYSLCALHNQKIELIL